MATLEVETTYRCLDDCAPQGCPKHKASLTYQSVSDSYNFTLGCKTIELSRGEIDAVMALLRMLDRVDAVQV